MKILFVAPSNSVHALRWIQRSIESGIRVDLYDLVPNASAPSDLQLESHFINASPKYSVHRIPVIGQSVQIFSEYRSLKSAIRKSNPDIIHCHWLFHSAPFVATFLSGKVPLISTPWGSDIQFPTKPLRGRLKKILVNKIFIRRIARKSSAFCCDSNVLADILEKNGAVRSKINIIYFGTDVERFSAKNRSTELRREFGASSADDLLVISNRSHEPVYDLPTLLFAAHGLHKDFPMLKYVIAGSGSLTEDLKQLTQELGISEIVRFTGRLNDDDFISATASCDIYVSTSTSDGGLAASTAEAMACEVPSVITNFGENSLWVDGTSTGLLFDIGDVEGLKSCLKKLVQDPELRRRFGQNGRGKIVSSNNSVLEWHKVLAMYESHSL